MGNPDAAYYLKSVQRQPFGNMALDPPGQNKHRHLFCEHQFPHLPNPGGFITMAHGGFTSTGVNYSQQGPFAGNLTISLPDVKYGVNGNECSWDGSSYFSALVRFHGSMGLSRSGKAEFVVQYGDYVVPTHAQFSLGTSTVLRTLGNVPNGDLVTGRFSRTY